MLQYILCQKKSKTSIFCGFPVFTALGREHILLGGIPFMKRIVAMLLVLVMVFALAACGNKPAPAPEPPKPKCRLTIVPEEDEQEVPEANEYEGTSIILTRENTEAYNRTITSKEQAELICEDGKWYILNKSEFGSTYLEANRKLEIQQGDIIVLGDRRFKFEVEQ